MTDNSPKQGGTIRPQRLKDHAYEYLKNQIVGGHITPGSILSERDIATQLNMSTTPVRGALERLEEQRFVTISAQRGAVLETLSPRQVTEHYDLRLALESFVVERISGKLTPEETSALEANLANQERAISVGQSWDEWAAADFKFHQDMCKILGNSEIEHIMQLQKDRLQWLVITIAKRDASAASVSCAEHVRIYEAVRDGNPEQARQHLAKHFNNGRRFLLLGGPYGGN